MVHMIRWGSDESPGDIRALLNFINKNADILIDEFHEYYEILYYHDQNCNEQSHLSWPLADQVSHFPS